MAYVRHHEEYQVFDDNDELVKVFTNADDAHTLSKRLNFVKKTIKTIERILIDNKDIEVHIAHCGEKKIIHIK